MTIEKKDRALLRLVLLSLAILVLAASGGHAQAQTLPDLTISFRGFRWIEDGGYRFATEYVASSLRLRVMTAPVPEPESWALQRRCRDAQAGA